MSRMKQALITMLPASMREPARNLYRRLRWGHLSNQQVFERIYERGLWGAGTGTPYDSGDGSVETLVQPYVATVTQLLRESGVASVVDVGCGDFRVGRLLTQALPDIRYVGVDVVRPLIDYNNARYGGPRVSFRQLDITRDALPEADACLVRQVFQHLSNAQITAALAGMRQYRCLVITESHPLALTQPRNMDKPAGPSVRHHGREGSGVYPDAPPFSLPVSEVLTVKRDDEAFPELLTTYWLDRRAAIS